MTGTAWTRRERVHLLVSSPDAPGGIARSTANLANHLVATHDVAMIGLRSRAAGRSYPLDPRVRVRYVVDEVPATRQWLDALPSLRAGLSHRQGQSALVDHVLPEVLRDLDPGVVISTRPLLHLAAARHAPAHCALVGQDHVNLEFRRANRSIRPVGRAIDRLARFVVLTEADAGDYRRLFPKAADRITVIPNAAPWPLLDHRPDRRRVIVAAGQLDRRKGFDRLIDAFAPIAPDRPHWRVHIYGEGPLRDDLAKQIADRGRHGRVVPKGRTRHMHEVLSSASLFALTSRHEGLPMVLIEALTTGVSLVSFDCPRGPAEILADGVTGRLVADGDVAGFTQALLERIDDPPRRRQMGSNALRDAARYQPEQVMQDWRQLLSDLPT